MEGFATDCTLEQLDAWYADVRAQAEKDQQDRRLIGGTFTCLLGVLECPKVVQIEYALIMFDFAVRQIGAASRRKAERN